MAEQGGRYPGGYSRQPQRRVIPYTPQYVEPTKGYRRTTAPSWLQAREPSRRRPLGVELPCGSYQASDFSTPLGEYKQEDIYETDTDEDDQDYDAVEETPEQYYYVPAYIPRRRQPGTYAPRQCPAIPTGMESPRGQQTRASSAGTPADRPMSFTQRMRQRLRNQNYYE